MSDTRQLFGGAITAILPHTLIDASDIRQVPDTQEVFLYPDSGTSIIIEALVRVAADDADAAARFHFDSLAHDNSATDSNVLNVEVRTESQGDTPPPIILHGTQAVPKFNSTTPDEVHILLALYRVQSKNVDLVLSMNAPTKTSGDGAISADGLAAAKRDFDVAATSLKILDFELFV
ncbi:Mog1p/PsbP-like protein [Irpex rosettiformis]|uniref:Mog1p/PsbP-like protein n=1 Tax=Irpex rosettiformis TaxID=378272 RepID=A0ACB8TPV1_9APHY|nr:Mog1p/PsbP-like protein [Irpex rosettiformis]